MLFAISGLGEIADLVVGIKISKKFKASRKGIFWGIIGATAGAIAGVPIPIIGSPIGMFIGAFIGTYVFEYSRKKDNQQALQAAKGFFLGRIGAIFIKVVLAIIMLTIIFGKLF